MCISWDKKNGKLQLSQERYIERVLNTPLASHFKLTSKQSPICEKKKEEMNMVPYASAVIYHGGQIHCGYRSLYRAILDKNVFARVWDKNKRSTHFIVIAKMLYM